MALAWIARAAGLAGTLVITRFLSPETVGEVGVAFVLVTTANFFTLLGLGHYVASKPLEGREATFHATVVSLAVGAFAIGAAVILRDRVAPLMGAPEAARYLPGLAVAIALDRIAFIPSRVLVRDMRFRANGAIRTAGELVFPIVAVGLAFRGHGGESLVWANIARSLVRTVGTLLVVRAADWLLPCRLRAAKLREIFAFGLPNGIAGIAGFAARYWDNLLMARMFGPTELGYYQLAYQLSDLPSNQVGEHVGDVLLPSFARVAPSRRAAALARAVRLLALIMFPLSLGLAVMGPTLVGAFLSDTWAPVGSRVTILAALSAVYPIGFAVHSYLNASNHPGWVMSLSLFRTVALLGWIAALGSAGGPLWACAGVGLAYGSYMVASLVVAARLERVSPRSLLTGMLPPLAACAPMIVAVLFVRHLLRSAGVQADFAYVSVELAAGALVYTGAVLAVAPALCREFLELLVKNLLARRRGRAKG